MKPAIIVFLAILALVALIAGFTVMQTTSDAGKVPLTICTDRDSYSLIMSSTVGIGLTPGYPASVDNRTVSFRWQTDYGNFLSWNAPDFKVNERGTNVTIDNGKIYWSYLSEDGKKQRPPVQVTLTMIDRATGKELGNARLEIGWDDRDNAVVRA
ncbi:MAG TPA: hypothetical protein VGJ92_07665 [Methanocella sp.]|jgi:hypothetical protein